MFPLEYPTRALRRHVGEGPSVLDPFCGRGTTLFAARMLSLNAWGIDSSPIAVAIAKAKMASCIPDDSIKLAQRLIEEFPAKEIPQTRFFRAAFAPRALRDICSIREGLLHTIDDTDASVLLRAAVLGCLHGPLSKQASEAGYFSNQMPRTYASKPSYAVRYWNVRTLKAPKIDVVGVLRRKLNRIGRLPSSSAKFASHVLLGDSRKPSTFKSVPKRRTVVVTSPPYYGMRTYIQDQWLRHWFLGGPSFVDYGMGPQLEHRSQAQFAASLGQVWANIRNTAHGNIHMYIRFGSIPSSQVDAKELLKSSLEASGIDWKLVSVRSASTAETGKRQAGQMKTQSNAADEYDFHVICI
jgi:hypothetical protein